MALRGGSSETIGLLDVTAAWKAFEDINKVKLVVEITHQVQNGDWALVMTVQAWGKDVETQEAKLLAWESARCSASHWSSLDIATFRLLYALDSALAYRELERCKKTA